MKTIFVFAYYGFKDPVFQSAVLPYLSPPKGESPRIRYILLTWEQLSYPLRPEEIPIIKNDLQSKQIIWYHLQWHSGRMKLIKKIYDFAVAIFYGSYLIQKYRASLIYSEGFPGAIPSHFLSLLNRIPHVIHTFEPHADYMLESKVWKRKSWEYLVLAKLEIVIAKKASALITATKEYSTLLKNRGVKTQIYALASCIDLEHFRFDESNRKRIRLHYGISDQQIVITYLGKLGGMYMSDEVFEMIKAFQDTDKERFVFFILTSSKKEYVNHLADAHGVDQHRIVCEYLSPGEVPSYLSASDFGFVGIIPLPSKRFCSPIKTGEYLACGLPVISPEGISDDSSDIQKLRLGIVYPNETNYHFVANEVLSFVQTSKPEETRTATRQLAQEKRDVELGRKLLYQIFENA